MPFVQIYRRAETIDDGRIQSIVSAVRVSFAEALMAHDPAHVVRPAMIDVKVFDIGPFDSIRGTVFVSCFARNEPERHSNRHAIVDLVRATLLDEGLPPSDVVELLLTDHSSSFDYSVLE